MIRSLNQIEHAARKATRGAGLPWGLADEAGKAVRWLHVYRLNGATALVELLDRHDYSNLEALTPASLRGRWQASGAQLDPLLSGASLCDCWERMRDAPMETGAIAYPLLAVGFIGALAESEDRAFTLDWPGARLRCRRGGMRIEGEARAVEVAAAAFLRCRLDSAEAMIHRDLGADIETTEAAIATRIWNRLEQYAHRTYVRASAASRLTGAG